MARLFRPLEPFKGWRKLAVHTWSPPRDPSTYALVDVPMGPAIAYCDRVRAESGVHVTVTHLTVKGVALALARFPQMNGIVSRGRIMLRDSVDIFMQVATSGGAELSGLKIANADRKSVLEIAREAEERIARIRARRDQQVERTKSVLDRVPARILGRMMRTIAYLIYDLDLDLSRFGVVKDEFGTAMVSNVGVFGIRVAFGPLVPFSRTPMVILMGAVEDRVVVEDGRPVVRPMMTLAVTLDHRFMDGFHGGAMAQTTREFLQNPEQETVVMRHDLAPVAATSVR
jgi:pyruvate/2-oxoglutarate dehydrogenase complex dihydrolipoamide acyltransferase (E2) component